MGTETKTKHTPGPWHVVKSGKEICVMPLAVAEDFLPICDMQADGGYELDNEERALAEANARLIAASPEMYDFIKQVANVLHFRNCSEEIIEEANELIARIEGPL